MYISFDRRDSKSNYIFPSMRKKRVRELSVPLVRYVFLAIRYHDKREGNVIENCDRIENIDRGIIVLV